MVITVGVAAHPVKRPHFQVEIFAKIFYLETMRIVDDIEQQIQKSEFLAILIHAMKSIGESRMTDHHRTVINGLLQKNLPIATYEQDLKVAPIWATKTIWNIAKKIGQWQNG